MSRLLWLKQLCYLHQGSYVYGPHCLLAYLLFFLIRRQGYAKSTSLIGTKVGGGMGHRPGKSLLNFGADPVKMGRSMNALSLSLALGEKLMPLEKLGIFNHIKNGKGEKKPSGFR